MPVIDKVIVGDIKCGGCVRVAQRALEQVAVIEAVSANFRKQTCSFEFLRPVEASVIDQALEAVGHATVNDAAPAPAPETLTALVREVVDGKSVRRYRCGCGCAECVCSDKPVWPGDEGVELTLEGLCDRLRTTGFGDGSLFTGDGLAATLRANGDAAATLLDAWDGRRVPCGCSDAEKPSEAAASAPASAAPPAVASPPSPAPEALPLATRTTRSFPRGDSIAQFLDELETAPPAPTPVAAPAPAPAPTPDPEYDAARTAYEAAYEAPSPRTPAVSLKPPPTKARGKPATRFDALSSSPPASPTRPRSPLIAQRRRPQQPARRRRPPPRRRNDDDDDALAEALEARRSPFTWRRASILAGVVAAVVGGATWRPSERRCAAIYAAPPTLEAIEASKRACPRLGAPDATTWWRGAGVLLAKDGQHDAAGEAFERATQEASTGAASAAEAGAAWFARGSHSLASDDLDAAAPSFAAAAASAQKNQLKKMYYSAHADVVLSRVLSRALAAYVEGGGDEDPTAPDPAAAAAAALCDQLPTCVRARVAAAAAGAADDAYSKATLVAGLRDAIASFDGAVQVWPALRPDLIDQQAAQVSGALRALKRLRGSTLALIAQVEG